MPKLRVGSGWGKLDFIAALERSTAGDVLVLDPGRYDVGGFYIGQRLSIVGSGAAGDTVLEGRALVKGTYCAFANLTLVAPSYENAIKMEGGGAHVEITSSVIVGERAGKYPTVWGDGGTLVLGDARIECEAEGRAINLSDGSTLHATRSVLGEVWLGSSRADLIDSTVSTLMAETRSRVKGYGTLWSEPEAGRRGLVLAGQSEGVLGRIVYSADYVEAMCDDSLLEIDGVAGPPGGVFRVFAENGAKVLTDDPGVTVGEPGEPAAEPGAPKSVHWPIEHARAFGERIAPRLSPGDTLLVDEGDYYLGESDDSLALVTSITGRGRADRTVLHGSVELLAGAAPHPPSPVIENVTIRPTRDERAVTVSGGAPTLTLRNVVLGAYEGSEQPALQVDAGRVVLHECAVEARSDALAGSIFVCGDARLEATRSELGWLQVTDGATAALDDCTSYQLFAHDRATISAEGAHFVRRNDAQHFDLVLSGGGAISIASLATDSDDFAVRATDASLVVGALGAPERGRVSVTREGDARIELQAEYELFEVVDEEQTFVGTVAPAERARAAGAEGARGAAEGAPPRAGDGAGGGADGEGDAPGGRSSRATEADRGADREPLAELNEMIGLAEVKAQAQSFINQVRFNRRREELGLKNESGFTLHSMFLGNPGTGKTTVARILGRALHEAGVVPTDTFVEADRSTLTSSNISGTAEKTLQVLESAVGGVLFIDEAYSLAQEGNTHFSQEAVDTILAFMENHRDDMMVIFAGYSDRMQDFLQMNEGLRSRIPNRFDFEDYTPDEIATIGLRALQQDDYRVDEALYRRVIAGAYAQSSDRSNGRWVRNFNQRLRQQMVSRVSALPEPTADDLTTIADADLHALGGGNPEAMAAQLDGLLEELNGLVGLESVKTWVRSLVNQAKVNQRMIEHDGSTIRPSYHMTFTGNPGTGKTTVARIVAGLFHALGVLSTSTVKEVDRAKLVGQYVGDSEKQTSQAVDEAMGGVLFVDEAYQLHVEDMPRDFGRQVIETLLPRLENDRDKFVAIFAGYSDDMERFYRANQGLKSRVPHTIEFPDYTPDEVGEIAVRALRKNWAFDEALLREVAAAAYDALPEGERSNGRWARNFTEQVGVRHTGYLVEHDVHGADMKRIPDEVLRSFMPGG